MVALDIIAEAGFRKVDLLGRMPHLSLNPEECDLAEIKDAAKIRGLQVANLGTYVGKGFASEDASTQERELIQVKRAIEAADFFGARSIRVTAGNDDPACMDRIVPWFQRAAEYAAEKQVGMGFETHGGGISGNPQLSADLSAKVGSPFFGVLYDPCNLMKDGTDYRVALWTMRDHIIHVHFKDAAVTDAGVGLTMLGKGQIDFAWIVGQLDAWGYDGDLALEYELEAEPPETALKKWYAASVAI